MIVHNGSTRYAERFGRGAERKPVAIHPGIELLHGEGNSSLFFAKSIKSIGVDAYLTLYPFHPVSPLLDLCTDK